MTYYVVTWTGPFGFIKPWTAVRDGETFSQQFLTPSIVEGMRQRLGVDGIIRHRLSHAGLSQQQERIQSAGYEVKKPKGSKQRIAFRNLGILVRDVMLDPVLHLAFGTQAEARRAADEHLCLCRNEDLVFPTGDVQVLSKEAFDQLDGFELRFGRDWPGAFQVGYNRYDGYAPMYGSLTVVGEAVKNAGL